MGVAPLTDWLERFRRGLSGAMKAMSMFASTNAVEPVSR
jgi:hypothetical protein